MNPYVDVLLIEDNIHDVHFVKHAIREAGMKLSIHHAINGQDAIDYIAAIGSGHDAPRMILTDIRMPRVDGHDLLRYVRSDDKMKDVPVVVLTTSDVESDIQLCYQLGANSYMVKPLDINVFIDSIAAVLGYWLQLEASERPEYDMEQFTRFCRLAA